MKTATVNLWLDARIGKVSGKYPVKIVVFFNGKKTRYGANIDLTKDQWEKINGERLRDESLKETKAILNEYVMKATEIIKEIEPFSFIEFERRFTSRTGEVDNVFFCFDEKVKKLNNNGQPATAIPNLYAKKSLREFWKKDKLTFDQVTPDFLNSYENWMLQQNRSQTTVSIYLRCLQAVFNDKIAEDSRISSLYPFGRRKYQVPASHNIKKALPIADIKKLFDYSPSPGTTEALSLDLWKFSYLCNGINITDICRLRYKNIDGNFIHFTRKKTATKSKADQREISVHALPLAMEIIKRYGVNPPDPDSFVFPFLKDGMTPAKQLMTVKQLTKNINKYIKRIAVTCGLSSDITTYTARHSFATVLKRAGASTEYISEQLGHHDLKTTENYLDSFEDSEKMKWQQMLLPD
jgi:integrase/recombinase XerD